MAAPGFGNSVANSHGETNPVVRFLGETALCEQKEFLVSFQVYHLRCPGLYKGSGFESAIRGGHGVPPLHARSDVSMFDTR